MPFLENSEERIGKSVEGGCGFSFSPYLLLSLAFFWKFVFHFLEGFTTFPFSLSFPFNLFFLFLFLLIYFLL